MKVKRGAAAVLLVDFLATLAVTTAAFVYDRLSPVDLLVLSLPTFVLFFVVGALLTESDRRQK